MIAILVAVIIGFVLAIGVLVARILWHKSQTAVHDQYRDIRYEKYSRLIDETIAEEPKPATPIEKQVGDEEVLEDLLHTKLRNVKGEDRTRVAAKINEMGLTADYIEGLSSSDPVKRARSLEVLGDLRMLDETDRFLQALNDDDGDVRLTAARGLANIIDEIGITGQDGEKARPLVQSLVSLLEQPDRWPPRRTAEVIVSLGPIAIDPVLEEIKSPQTNVRTIAADILGAIGDLRVTDPLIEALSDPETDVRARAASALGTLGDPKAAKPLIKALQDDTWPVRARAAKSLGKIGDQIAIWPLAEILKDRQWWVRRNAGYALAGFGEPGFDMLEKNLANPDRYAAERALEVLEETGRIGEFIKDLGSEQPKARERAVALMVTIGRIGGLAPIIEATKETRDTQAIISLIEVWRELTEHLADALASGDKQSEMQSIESMNKIVYSFVLADIGSFRDLKIANTQTSLDEIEENVANIKQSVVYLGQDVDPEIREEAASTLNFMER